MSGNILVLTTSGELSDSMVKQFAVSGDTNRLGVGAVEIYPYRDIQSSELYDISEALKVDANLVSPENRLKKLLLADMDSTIIPVECIDELADFAGVKAQVSKITEAAMAGKLNFETSLLKRVRLLEGLSVDVLQKTFDERVSLNPGAEIMVSTMRKLGSYTAMISGGFTFFTSKVSKRVGFDYNKANFLELDGDLLTGYIEGELVGPDTKMNTLLTLSKNFGFGPDDVFAIGDGANDIPMIEAAGLGVAYYGKPALKAVANCQLNHSDLRAALYLQGIPETEHVSSWGDAR